MSREKSSQPLVSIIMPTYNAGQTLKRCLASVQSQTYSNIELIVVDRGSSDQTRLIAESYGCRVLEAGCERTSQFNFGARSAKGDYIYYIGSDFLLDPLIVEKAVAAAQETGADAVVVPNQSDASISFWASVRALERGTYANDSLMEAARFFSKDAYFAVGGYDDTMVAYEEHDLHNRLVLSGYTCARIEGAGEVHIGEPRSLSEIARKHFYYGRSIAKYVRKYPAKAIVQLAPVRMSYLRHWKDFVLHPVLTCGFVVYQVTRYGAAGLALSLTLATEMIVGRRRGQR